MNAVEKVIEDLRNRFRNRLQGETYYFSEQTPDAKLRGVYRILLRKCFSEFISFLQHYTFPEQFIHQFSFPLAGTRPEDMEILKLLRLIEVNIYALGQIRNIGSLHLILYHTPETFKKIVKHHPEVINIEKHVMNTGMGYYPVYPDDREAVELFVKKYVMPWILPEISPSKTLSTRKAYGSFLRWAWNLQKEILREVFVEVSRRTGKKNLWFCLSELHPLIKKHPELFLLLVKHSPAFRKRKKESPAGETIPWRVRAGVTEEVFRTLSDLPEKVVEALVEEKASNKNLYVPSPLWIPLLNRKCFRKYPELTKKILMNLLSRHADLLEEAGCRIHVPESALSVMSRGEMSCFLSNVYSLYGTRIFFPLRCIPDERRREFELIYRTKWLMKDMFRKYCRDGEGATHSLFVLISRAYEKHMSDEEVDTLIEIALQYWGIHALGRRICAMDGNYALNRMDTSFLSPEECERYFTALKKLLHDEKSKAGKKPHQLQLFAEHEGLTEMKKRKGGER